MESITDIGWRGPQSSPILSVVVCTRDRCSKLKRCVDALLSVTTARDWELVIVDNGSTDGTSEYLASIDKKQFNRVHVKTIYEPKRGKSHAINTGWRASAGEIVAFTDDDCYVTETYVDSILQVFENHPEVGFWGGCLLLFDPMDSRVSLQESQQRCYFQPGTFIYAGDVSGANMAFKRSSLERIGGFDERLGPGTPFISEDIDAVAAALWAGIPGVYDPTVVVYHHHGRRTEREAQEIMRSYDAGRGAYYAKYILRKDSRSAFLRAWIRSIKYDCVTALRQRRLPKRSLREITSGLRFVLHL
jgi:glycosyltransferase involved in cell wall biosynthesis